MEKLKIIFVVVIIESVLTGKASASKTSFFFLSGASGSGKRNVLHKENMFSRHFEGSVK